MVSPAPNGAPAAGLAAGFDQDRPLKARKCRALNVQAWTARAAGERSTDTGALGSLTNHR